MEALAQTPTAPAPEVKAPPRLYDVPDGVEAYVQRFTEIWAEPRNAESFTDRFMDYVDPDITMIQPWLFYPMCHGVKGFKKQFRRYFTALPDLNGRVIRWSAMGDTVWIELELTCWHRRRPLSFRVIDRTIMRDGRAIERRVFGDPLPLLLGAMTRPYAWPRALLSYLRPR
jgi:ketosteroid isomerase-like protein